MDYHHRITCDPRIMLGKPVVRGTRITVELLLGKLAQGMRTEEILEAYPGLQREDVLAAISYSADVVSREEMIVS
jgi:uncharacterized protein (DUF433 family)